MIKENKLKNLSTGDIIKSNSLFDKDHRYIVDDKGDNFIDFRDIDFDDFGGILVGNGQSLVYDGWQDQTDFDIVDPKSIEQSIIDRTLENLTISEEAKSELKRRLFAESDNKQDETKTVYFNAYCTAAYKSSLKVPKDIKANDLIKYITDHLDECPAMELEYISDAPEPVTVEDIKNWEDFE